jgi:hypothetical protein
MSYVCALTTVDNPFDPIDEFDSWFDFDMDKGYNSCAYLDRIAKTSNELTEQENQDEIESAIDEIIKLDFMNIYRKVKHAVKGES